MALSLIATMSYAVASSDDEFKALQDYLKDPIPTQLLVKPPRIYCVELKVDTKKLFLPDGESATKRFCYTPNTERGERFLILAQARGHSNTIRGKIIVAQRALDAADHKYSVPPVNATASQLAPAIDGMVDANTNFQRWLSLKPLIEDKLNKIEKQFGGVSAIALGSDCTSISPTLASRR